LVSVFHGHRVVDVLLWAEGSESRAVERGPGGSKDIGVGKSRCHREFDPADADANLGANFQQLQADGAACSVGEAGRGQGDAAQIGTPRCISQVAAVWRKVCGVTLPGRRSTLASISN
jgi:hypothetical protein